MSEKDLCDFYRDLCGSWEAQHDQMMALYDSKIEFYKSLVDTYKGLVETYRCLLEDDDTDTELDEEDMLLVDDLMDDDEDLDFSRYAYLDFDENELPEIYDEGFEELDFSEFDDPEEEFEYVEDELWPLN